MGTGQSQLRKEDLDILIQNTHFDVRELKAIFKQFRKEIVTDWISREQFKEVLKQMGVLDSFVQDLIFNAFDKNQDGMIDFQEFIIGTSTMIRGDPDEKLEFAFRMYDINRRGYLEKTEIRQIMESFSKLVGPLNSSFGRNIEMTQALVDEFFDVMDADRDGRISLEEYKAGAMKNPNIIRGLKLFSS